jgi:antitoxin component YwqK of YwqJK toxin-antitoxin module
MSRKFLYPFLFVAVAAQAQQNEPRVQEGQFTFETDKPFSLLELDEKIDEPIVVKKKKPKKKTFYGVKTKKAFTRKGYAPNITVELFYVLKVPEKYSGFARDIYWYDFTRREIRHTDKFDPEKGVLLHGPYKRMVGQVVLEEGIFYKGAKHGRWMRFDKQDLLDDKDKYYKGLPKESLITYYDPVERKRIKEIVPIEFGEREGYYYLYHENGKIAVVGEYRWDQKVNDWTENYPSGGRKKIVRYPKEPFDKETHPFIHKEWNDKGKEIYSANN